jgi:outer membrane lipoprotein-sorting protein
MFRAPLTYQTVPIYGLRFMKFNRSLAVLLSLLVGLLLFSPADLQAAPLSPDEIVTRMRTAYEKVTAYRTEVETSEYRGGRIDVTRRFLFSFRKPNRMRIDMETPHPGMRLVYPDRDGRVFVQFGGWLSAMKVRLAPDNSLFATRAGQRLDKSDFGLLIRNIGRSVGEERVGETKVVKEDGQLLLEVVARDHFQPGVVTRYRFLVDKSLWLPVAVEESTPEGLLKRTIHFRNIEKNPQFPGDFFQIE